MSDQPKKRPETKVLLLDSNREDLERLATALKQARLRAVSLTHFDVAPALYSALKPDAVILASKAADISRMDIVPRLRQLSSGTLSLFWLLEHRDADAKMHFLEKLHGCDVMVKPVDERELIAKIRSSVRIKRCVQRAVRAAGERPVRMGSGEIPGSYSRGVLEAMIAQEARRAERHGGTFSVLVSALEGFEQFKKAFGPEWARVANKHAARILRHSTRECDVLAKLDDSRFALLLPGTGSEGVPALRSRLKINFQRLPIEFQERWMKTTVLIGAASFPEVVGTARSMIAAAYEDLRRSRETQGRSRAALIA